MDSETKNLLKQLVEEVSQEQLKSEYGNVFVKKEYMKEQIKKEVEEQKVELEKKEIEDIVKELLSDLETTISRVVKGHLLLLVNSLSEFVNGKFK